MNRRLVILLILSIYVVFYNIYLVLRYDQDINPGFERNDFDPHASKIPTAQISSKHRIKRNTYGNKLEENIHFENGIPFPKSFINDTEGLRAEIKRFFSRNHDAPFPYDYMLQNTDFCDPKTRILILTPIEAVQFQQRKRIRNMWAARKWRSKTKMKVLFLLGNSTKRGNERVALENMMHQDLVQMNFRDTYGNLTFKILSGWRWVNDFCPNVDWVVKSDSDVFVNIFSLSRFLNNYDRTTKFSRSEILCHSKNVTQLIPQRNFTINKKWGVTYFEYPFDVYPRYCSGGAYIIPRSLIPSLYAFSDKLSPFRMEDAYYTGIVPLLPPNPIKIRNVVNLMDFNSKKFTKDFFYNSFLVEWEAFWGKGAFADLWKIISSKKKI